MNWIFWADQLTIKSLMETLDRQKNVIEDQRALIARQHDIMEEQQALIDRQLATMEEQSKLNGQLVDDVIRSNTVAEQALKERDDALRRLGMN
jgi:hypothetical protein